MESCNLIADLRYKTSFLVILHQFILKQVFKELSYYRSPPRNLRFLRKHSMLATPAQSFLPLIFCLFCLPYMYIACYT